MPPRGRTRYYPAVGPAIPRRWLRSSRVTHPSATEPLRVPFDLHVLATPPAFRLSQDQTLQLNFLARVTPDAPCDSCELTETDTFATRVYPRNEFVQTT